MAAIVSSTFLYALDGTIVAVLQPGLIKEFGHIKDLSWLSVAFLLCATATNLAWGRVYSNFNAKWLYIFYIFIFEVGSAICGAAPSINVLILGRAIAGMSGSGQYIGCMTLIAATTTMTERPMYVSLTGLSWGLGTVLGPVIGAAFAQSSVGWRWGFYINLFVGAACAPAWLFLIPSKDPRPGTPFRARAAEIDYAGITLQAGMLAALLLAVNLGGVTFPWDSGRIIALFVVWCAFHCTGRSAGLEYPHHGGAAHYPCAILLVVHGAYPLRLHGSKRRFTLCADLYDTPLLLVHAYRRSTRCRRLAAPLYCCSNSLYYHQWHPNVEAGLLHAVVSSGRLHCRHRLCPYVHDRPGRL